jgi:hypothetical protein
MYYLSRLARADVEAKSGKKPWLAMTNLESSLETQFNRALVKSVEETITLLLGKSVAGALSYHLYAYLGLAEDDIPSHLKELFATLNYSFGVSGNVVGRAIVRRLYAKLGLVFVEKPNATLVQYVDEARLKFMKTDSK